MKMLEMMPISPESTVLPIPVSTIPPPTTTTTTRTAHNAGNEEQQTTVASRNKSSDNPPPSNTRPSTAENIPLPDFGSPEFNPYSKEEFLDATQEEGIQQFINIEVSVNSPLDYNNYLGPIQIHDNIDQCKWCSKMCSREKSRWLFNYTVKKYLNIRAHDGFVRV
ncbi:hypothetical protein L798_09359 [Zootermopsis nevadensis]|uniref:Uncharacterized protein n=3 Tax=Zootermopsis nevadensis TaxID=136037 RepID=A0A067R1W2_ZOONE|nr:hypothetical protein L798_09359 [Zootermopsis nevadensis]